MKSTPDYMDKNTVCPFYILEEQLKIRCEGYSQKNRLHLCFSCKESKREHKKRFCNTMEGYEECPLYSIIIKQYNETEDKNE